MKKLHVEVSDEEFATLERLAQALGVSVEDLVKRSVAVYLPQAQTELPFEPIGFGMWADRPEMQDATKWVEDLRGREWTAGNPRYRCVHRSFSGPCSGYGLPRPA